MTTDLLFDPETGEIIEPTRPNVAELTVSELSQALKRTLEDSFQHVRVRGEVGKVSRPGSGHCYFDLKDDSACLAAVVWKLAWNRLRFKPEQGMEVIVTGRISTFPGQSKYQIVVDTVSPAGQGALMAMLEERRRKLAAEGLFDEARKKPIPVLPKVIGVVTSPTGAVIRDILHRLSERFPRRVIVWPVRVQGETCAAEVAAAIAGFNALQPDGPIPRPDLLIVARGGGSIEDLWGFNDEAVVRAAAASDIPLISAIGHETDVTLLDHAADLRAPTPTAAAERAVPVRADLFVRLGDIDARQRQAVARRLADARLTLRAAARLPRVEDVVAGARQRYETAAGRLAQALIANVRIHRADFQREAGRLSPQPLRLAVARRHDALKRLAEDQLYFARDGLRRRAERLDTTAKLLNSLSYRAVLARGFALVRAQTGEPLHAAAETHPSQGVAIEFHDGSVAARLEGPTATPRPSRRKPPGTADGQGSLF
ncbi:MAG: exodeoxyribonuclease VII large subunit [Hyphomicrobiales bacterium]